METYLELLSQYCFGETFGFSSITEESRLRKEIQELWKKIK